jgi:copper chaperone CopZ
MDEHKNCNVEPLDKPLDESALSTAVIAYLAVGGMGCPRCATRVRDGLLKLDGVLFVEVQLEDGIAAAAYEPNRVNSNDLLFAIVGAGNDGNHNYSAQMLEQLPARQVISF